MKIKTIAAVFLAIALCLTFIGCADRGPGDELIDREEQTEFTPAADAEVDEELLRKYNLHKENAPLAFKSNSENPASDFQYSLGQDGIKIEKYTGEGDVVVIPDAIEGKSVTRICAGSFSGSSIRAVYVPDSVTAIERGAFENCADLATMRLPFIGDGEGETNGGVIFGSDDHISNGIKVPGSLKMLIVGEGEVEIPADSLSYFKNLEAVILPAGIQKIGQFAFYECRSLVYVDLGGVKAIEEYAFLSCDSMISLEIPDSVVEISLGAFMQCDSLKYISLSFVGGSREENRYIGYVFGAENKAWNNSFVPSSLSYVTIRGDEVPSMAFEGCDGLIDITLADGVKSIGERAFSNCRSMQSVIFADSVESIGADAFSGCLTLEKIEFSSASALKNIGMQAFLNCDSLKEVKLPSGITSLPVGVFSGCVSLERLTGVNIDEVGARAFYGCSLLASVNGINKDGVVGDGNGDLIKILEQ